MSKVKSFVLKLCGRLYAAVKRYPIAIFLLLFAAVMAMMAIDINSNNKSIDDKIFIRFAMISVYGAIFSLVIKGAADRFSFKRITEWLCYLAVPASMALVYLLLMPDFDNMTVMIKYMLLCMLTASLFFFIPFIKSDKSASYFAQKVFLRIAVTMIYYGIITGGVEAIIFAMENLLSVKMPNAIYEQTAVLLAGLFIPSFLFSGIPKKDDAQDSYPKLLKILLHYIVFPLLTAYTVVLYAYFIKILAKWQLPSNLLGNLVIYYSLISVAALYFGHFKKDDRRWTGLFYGIFPYALILPTLMMLLSFIVRIRQYGFTEPRYYAILCVIFVLLSISIIKLQKKVRVIPLALSALLLVSIFGPLSSFNVSKWSQNRRFERILTQAGMLQDGKIVPKSDADDDTKHEITQIVSYFNSRGTASDLKYTDKDIEISDMEEVFGFESSYINKPANTKIYYIYGDYENTHITDVSDYDFFAEVHSNGEKLNFEKDGAAYSITASDGDGDILTISKGESDIYTINMYDLLMPYLEKYSGSDEAGEYIFTDETAAVSVKIIILHAQYDESGGSSLYYDVKLLFTIK